MHQISLGFGLDWRLRQGSLSPLPESYGRVAGENYLDGNA